MRLRIFGNPATDGRVVGRILDWCGRRESENGKIRANEPNAKEQINRDLEWVEVQYPWSMGRRTNPTPGVTFRSGRGDGAGVGNGLPGLLRTGRVQIIELIRGDLLNPTVLPDDDRRAGLLRNTQDVSGRFLEGSLNQRELRGLIGLVHRDVSPQVEAIDS